MMTGEELCFLITRSVESTEGTTPKVASRQLLWYRGYCPCVRAVYLRPTAQEERYHRQGYHTDRAKIVVDADLAVFGKGIRWNPLKNDGMDDNWKKTWQQIATGILFVLSQTSDLFSHWMRNLRQIRYDTSVKTMYVSTLVRNVNGNKIDEESAGKIQDYWKEHIECLTQNRYLRC